MPLKNFPWLARLGRGASKTAALASILGRLRSMGSATEDDFLDLGRRLEQIVKSADEQRDRITRLLEDASQASGEDAGGVLDEIASWAQDAAGGQDGRQQFERLVPVVGAVREPLSALQKALRALRVMSISARVESARLGGRSGSFWALANEVVVLADAIDVKSSAILDAVNSAGELLARTQERAAAVDLRERAAVRAMTAECLQGLTEMREQERRICEVTSLTGQRYQALTREVGDIVTELQCHDRTRQRIEHIVEALERPAPPTHLIELQAMQLDEARREFVETVESIRADLSGLAQTIDDCTGMVRGGIGGNNGAQQRFVAGLVRRLEAIAASMSDLSESRATVSGAAAEVQQACIRMSGFVAEIEAISISMLRLALNAEIQAAHLSETGVVMQAVAAGIRSASESASRNAAAAGQALRQVEMVASSMNRSEASGSGGRGFAPRLRQFSSELDAAARTGAGLLASIATENSRIAQEIAAARDSITADRILDQAAGPCVASLREIAEAGRSGSREALAHAGLHYTMHSEREVHANFLGAAPAEAEHPAQESALGDNVELF